MIRWAVSRPAVVWASVLVVLVAGGVSFTRLALATKTTIELPQLSISAGWYGASAELVRRTRLDPRIVVASTQGRARSAHGRLLGAARTTPSSHGFLPIKDPRVYQNRVARAQGLWHKRANPSGGHPG